MTRNFRSSGSSLLFLNADSKAFLRAVAKGLKAITRLSKKPKIRVLAVIGVNRSPTCGVELTSIRRNSEGNFEYVETRGLFMEALERELNRTGLKALMIGLDLKRPKTLLKRIETIEIHIGQTGILRGT